MLLDEMFEDWNTIEEVLEEGARVVWTRRGDELIRKYRCTNGRRHGQVVTLPNSCGTSSVSKRRFALTRNRNRLSQRMVRHARMARRYGSGRKFQL